MTQWTYAAPFTLRETLHILGDTVRQTQALAGGTRLLVDIRQGVVWPEKLIDLQHLEDLQQICFTEHAVNIGARVTLAQVEHNKALQQRVPLLTEMAKSFGNPLIRRSATLGGNIATARVMAADAVVPLCALDATLVLQKERAHSSMLRRAMRIAEYIRETPDPSELITWITIPVLPYNTCSFYYKLGNRKAGATALVSIAVRITAQNQYLSTASVVLGAITCAPFRVLRVEELLRGEVLPLRTGVIEECVRTLEEDLPEPLHDVGASASYRAAMGSALLRKALQQMHSANENVLERDE